MGVIVWFYSESAARGSESMCFGAGLRHVPGHHGLACRPRRGVVVPRPLEGRAGRRRRRLAAQRHSTRNRDTLSLARERVNIVLVRISGNCFQSRQIDWVLSF